LQTGPRNTCSNEKSTEELLGSTIPCVDGMSIAVHVPYQLTSVYHLFIYPAPCILEEFCMFWHMSVSGNDRRITCCFICRNQNSIERLSNRNPQRKFSNPHSLLDFFFSRGSSIWLEFLQGRADVHLVHESRGRKYSLSLTSCDDTISIPHAYLTSGLFSVWQYSRSPTLPPFSTRELLSGIWLRALTG
jgi:hypothetical protein